MSAPWKILLLEDSATDAELNEHALRKAGIAFTGRRVERREDFLAALDAFSPDLILADYKLPQFDGLQALALAREHAPRTPFIFVTGAMGEEFAVETLRQGATDYILKDRLTRLPAAVQRAMEERATRQARWEAEEKFRLIFEGANDGIVLIAGDGRIVSCNPEFMRQTGRALEALQQMAIWELRPASQVEPARERFAAIWRDGTGGAGGLDFLRPDGTVVPIEFRGTTVTIGGERYLLSIARDITERRQAEQALRASEERYHQLFEHMGSGVVLYQPDAACARFTIKAVNGAVEKIERIGREHLLGADVEAVFPGVRTFGLLEVFTRVCRSGTPEHMAPALYRDARIEGWRENYVYRLQSGEIVAVYDDVTSRVLREQQVARLNRTLRTINACNQLLVRATQMQGLLEENCRILVEMGGYQAAWVGLVEGGEAMRYAAHRTRTPQGQMARQGAEWHRASPCAAYLLRQVLETRQAVVLQDMARAPLPPEVAGCAEAEGMASAIALPLHCQQAMSGIMILFSGQTDVFDELELRLLAELSDDIAYGLKALRTVGERNRYISQWTQALKNTVAAIARTLEKRDPYTAGHQQRVAQLAAAMARTLALPEETVEGLQLGGMIHDIGKISVPAEILSKPGRLTELEYKLIQAHPEAGYEILQGIEFPWPVAQMVYQHHERLDGSGYPRGLEDDEICLEARILAVADVVEAMVAHRPYRPGQALAAALAEIEQHRGALYDPDSVDACLSLFREQGFHWD